MVLFVCDYHKEIYIYILLLITRRINNLKHLTNSIQTIINVWNNYWKNSNYKKQMKDGQARGRQNMLIGWTNSVLWLSFNDKDAVYHQPSSSTRFAPRSPSHSCTVCVHDMCQRTDDTLSFVSFRRSTQSPGTMRVNSLFAATLMALWPHGMYEPPPRLHRSSHHMVWYIHRCVAFTHTHTEATYVYKSLYYSPVFLQPLCVLHFCKLKLNTTLTLY